MIYEKKLKKRIKSIKKQHNNKLWKEKAILQIECAKLEKSIKKAVLIGMDYYKENKRIDRIKVTENGIYAVKKAEPHKNPKLITLYEINVTEWQLNVVFSSLEKFFSKYPDISINSKDRIIGFWLLGI